MEKELEKRLDDLIAKLRKGENVEEYFAQNPEQRSELQPLLEVAQAMQRLPKPEPAPELVSATLVSVGREAARYQGNRSLTLREILSRRPRIAWALGVAFVLLLAFTGMTFISGNSIPGDVLYPVKLGAEKVKFLLTYDAQRKAELRLTFSDERLRELIGILQRSGTLDTDLLKAMLDEAKLALENENQLPEQQASFIHIKFNHVNAYQKESLGRIRRNIPPSEREKVDKAIEVCGNRMRWMMRRMKEGGHVPWGRSCDM